MMFARTALALFAGFALASSASLTGLAQEADGGEQAEPGAQEGDVAIPDGDPAESEARGFKPYLKIISCEYVPAAQAGGKQLLRLKFDLDPAMPVGTKLEMKLLYTALEVDKKEFELKDARRSGIIYDWRPENELGPDDQYSLLSAIWPDNQTPQVQKAFESLADRFPPAMKPWVHNYLRPEELISIGTEEELAALKEKVCKFYEDTLNDLVANYKEIQESIEAVKAGKKLAEGGVLKADDLAKLVKTWQKKQAGVQKKIRELPLTEMTLHQKSLTAHQELLRLGQIVSRAGVKLVKEVEKQYGIPPVRVEVNPKDASDKVLIDFDANWRYKTDTATLQKQLERVLELACPSEEPEEEAAATDEEGEAGAEGEGEAGSAAAAEGAADSEEEPAEEDEGAGAAPEEEPKAEEPAPAPPKEEKPKKGAASSKKADPKKGSAKKPAAK